MKKSDLVSKLVERIEGLNGEKASKIVNEVFEIISEELQNGGSYSQDKFGTFKVTTKLARKGRNPKTGEEILIPEKKSPKWVISKQLKDRVSQ
jgi:nucleoid DNA-binding protein